jgi:DNA invertase Pin-like site-specific DNA recombinase
MIFVYARVSTLGQDEEGAVSIPEQLKKCRALAAMRGVSSKDCVNFIDRDTSGSIPLAFRLQGKEMLASLQKGDCIVASKMDRLFRSAIDALQTAEELKQRGVDLVLIDISSEPVTGNGVGKMFFSIMACFAEFERDRIRERTEEGRRGKRARRGFMGGGVPLGFRVVGKGRDAQLEEDAREQEAKAWAKKAAKSGHGPNRIAKYLSTHYPTRSGKAWQVIQVQRLLQKEAA